ncbi:sterile alpha motif domain-containing protein 7 [Trichomycterus rosablanca]|uniref:sterile alpha motif domain-containing protein 7 n=1 Tax=Trichomycterus rosablanca TaxID=2290929 RepID=UPI002F35D170
MTPREQLRKMTTLVEQDDKHWYRLVNSMSAGELRQRQEMMMRNSMVLTPQVLGQQRLQFEPRFMDRDLVPPAEMVSSSEPRHLGPPLPPHSTVLTGRGFAAPGQSYGFLPPESMETVARRQEILHKQNIARMEMNAILQQKELENQQKNLMENPMMFQHVNPSPTIFRGRHRLQDGHEVFDLHTNSFLMSAGPYPPISTMHRERGRRPGRRPANQKCPEATAFQAEEKNVDQSPGGASVDEKEPEHEERSEISTDANANANKPHLAKMDGELAASGGRKAYCNGQSGLRNRREQTGSSDPNLSGANSEKNVRTSCSSLQEKFLYPPAPLSTLPYMFQNSLLPPAPPGLFLNPEEISAVEDLRKWTVEDVSNFISNIPSCSEHAQVFKDHLIDGETLPLLTEDHLLETLGLKLGPALKIRSQVLRRMGGALFMGVNVPLSAPSLQQPIEKHSDRSCDVTPPITCSTDVQQSSPHVNQCENVHQSHDHHPPSTRTEST